MPEKRNVKIRGGKGGCAKKSPRLASPAQQGLPEVKEDFFSSYRTGENLKKKTRKSQRVQTAVLSRAEYEI